MSGGGGRQFRGAEVVLHVYDLSPINQYSYEFGVGAFHSGVELSGTEYTYGGHERASSGIFTHSPKSAPNAAYRSAPALSLSVVLAWRSPVCWLRAVSQVSLLNYSTQSPMCTGHLRRTSISMGETTMSTSDVRAEIASLGEYFKGNQYHLITRNCNHFSDALVERLTHRRIPGLHVAKGAV